MSELVVTPTEVTVRLSGWERLGAVRRDDVVVPRAAVVSARAVPVVWSEIRGIRAPGYGLPHHAAVGIWRHDGVKDFVCVQYGTAGVVVDLVAGGPFARLVLSVPDPAAVLARLGVAAGGDTVAP
jgi:hypothetical protein